ncbi:hypothetical protein EAO71_09500 [Streptomyces sp. ms191]|nr:hypothetical protein EAO71_09500 [Streptomyces sp. ms191]
MFVDEVRPSTDCEEYDSATFGIRPPAVSGLCTWYEYVNAPDEDPADHEPEESSGDAVKSPCTDEPVSIAPMTCEPEVSAAENAAVRAEAPETVEPVSPPRRSATGTEPVRILRVLAFFAAVVLVGASLGATTLTELRRRSNDSVSSLPDMVSTPSSTAQSPVSGEEMTHSGSRTRPKRSAACGP